MNLTKNNPVVGLDIGSHSAKAVALRHDRKAVSWVGSNVFDFQTEGILDEAELRAGVSEWLRQIGWAGNDICVGLPQYLTTTQVADFPPGVGTSGLEEMVEYETHQLAGLSEESFLHDFQSMPARFGRKNPALIGICRESVVRERARATEEAGIGIADMAMGGTAIANAFFELRPDAYDFEPPQLILDIGAESSTLIIAAGGQVLFVGSLLFGASRYTKALSSLLGIDEAEAERRKQSGLDAGGVDSPLREVSEQLETELSTAVDNWRAQERPEIGNRMFAKVWLCGGGANAAGLDSFLARTYGCPAESFGPVDPDTREEDPSLVTAYGLALQAMVQGRMVVSLCPPEITWTRHRRKRFGYLVAAVALTCLFIAANMVGYYKKLGRQQKFLIKRVADLERCRELIPQLEDAQDLILHHERILIPFVEKGNRARRFLGAIGELSDAYSTGDWFIYLADQFSYEDGIPEEDKEPDEDEPPEPRARGATPGVPMIGALADRSVSTRDQRTMIPVDLIPPLKGLVAAGYARHVSGDSYAAAKRIIRKLNRLDEENKPTGKPGLFKGVDLMKERERVPRRDIFAPWQEFLKSLKQNKREFAVALRFDPKQLDVRRPPQETEAE